MVAAGKQGKSKYKKTRLRPFRSPSHNSSLSRLASPRPIIHALLPLMRTSRVAVSSWAVDRVLAPLLSPSTTPDHRSIASVIASLTFSTVSLSSLSHRLFPRPPPRPITIVDAGNCPRSSIHGSGLSPRRGAPAGATPRAFEPNKLVGSLVVATTTAIAGLP